MSLATELDPLLDKPPQILQFKMVRFATASHGAVVVWKDGEVSIYADRATPGQPVKIAVDGNRPSEEQLAALRIIWHALVSNFRYHFLADFCPVLTSHAGEIAEMFLHSPAIGQEWN